MKAIVASQRHGLLPFAWRLKKEGVEVKTVVWRDKYEAAWGGVTDKVLKGTGKNRESLAALVKEAKNEDTVVLADSARGMTTFAEAHCLFGIPVDKPQVSEGPIMVGGWFDGDKMVRGLTHLLVVDQGLWPGGLGPALPGGASLISCPNLTNVFDIEPYPPKRPKLDQLRDRKWRGLVRAGINLGEEGQLVVTQFGLGWNHIQAHAFLSELYSFSGLLSGASTNFESKCVVVAPFSVPPYPIGGQHSAKHQPIGGISEEHTKHIFFHDFLAKENHELWVAGLDGFVGVVRGAGATLPLARMRCQTILQALQLEEKQARFDIGSQADSVLGVMEENGLISSSV